MKVFIFSCNNVFLNEYMSFILNDTKAIEAWVSPITNTAIIISQLSVSDLSAVLHGRLGETWFILVEASPSNTNGWLPGNFWEYISNPHSIVQNNYLSKLFSDQQSKGLLNNQ